MKPKEVWHKWLPDDPNLSKKYVVTAIEDIIGAFNIYLHDKRIQKSICLNFYKSALIFRKTDINYRFAELERISSEQSEQKESFCKEWSFFKISDSEYLNELIEEACGILNPQNFIHFVIVGSNCVVDVITNYEPMIIHID